MNRLALVAAFVLAVVSLAPRSVSADDKFSKSSCSFKGKQLWGKIQVVNAFPDVKVQIVKAFADVKVQVVKAFPDKCGKWEMVEAFPDTKVQFVDAFPDVKIEYVDAFPGTN